VYNEYNNMEYSYEKENCTDQETFFDVNELNDIREKIETMQKFNQVEVLRILNNNTNVMLNENKYGIHINLSELSRSVIEELKIYISYVTTQEINLGEIERQKESFKTKYFTKDNKDNCIEESS
jgi:hypothetical protein